MPFSAKIPTFKSFPLTNSLETRKTGTLYCLSLSSGLVTPFGYLKKVHLKLAREP